jgi:hypothetical protein
MEDVAALRQALVVGEVAGRWRWRVVERATGCHAHEEGADRPRRRCLGSTWGPAAPGVVGGRGDRWEGSGRLAPEPKGRQARREEPGGAFTPRSGP